MGTPRVVLASALALSLVACKGKEKEAAKQPDKTPVVKPETKPVKPIDAPPLPPLAADPGDATGTVRWAVPIGGLGSDVSRDLAVDAQGGVVVCGDFEEETSFGALGKRTVAGKSDAFLLHVAADGKPDWQQSFGGPLEETCEGVAIGKDGTIVAGGLFSDTATLGTFTSTTNGSDDLWVGAFKPDGTPAWLWTTGGPSSDTVLALAATPDGAFLAAGGFFGDMPVDEQTRLTANHEDAFLAKVSADGKLLWAKRYGGEYGERIVRLAVDGQGSIYALAAFQGTSNFGGEPLVSAGAYDIALIKLTPDGEHVWSKGFGGVDNDGAVGLAIDPAGNVTFVGSYDQKIAIGKDTYQARGTSDVLVVHVGASGEIAWTRSLGGAGEDIASGVAADAAGNIVVGGWFEKDVDFGKGKVTSNGNKDLFVLKLDATGALRWVQTWGGRDHDKVRAAAITSDGNIYVAGIFRYAMNLPTPIESVRDPADRAPKSDAFVMRLDR
jgi:hypothetical protein